MRLDRSYWLSRCNSLSQTLWEGSWSSGSITVEGLSRYTLLVLHDNFGNAYIGMLSLAYLQAVSCWARISVGSNYYAQDFAVVGANRSGDTLELVGISYFSHVSGADHVMSDKTYTIKRIVGII